MEKNKIISWAKEVLKTEAEAILKVMDQLDEEFIKAIECILKCEGKVIITAIGKSGHIGRKIAATMASTGTPAFFVHPSEAYHGDLGMISKKDVVIAISYRGASAEVLNIIPVIKRIGVPIIAIVGIKNSPLAKASDIVIQVKVEKEADFLNLAPTSSTTATLALGDALAVVLLKLKNFTSKDFAFFHPGGSLGRDFLTVGEIMRKKLPVVLYSDDFDKALKESSEKNLGAVCIINDENKLLGIITDGDIRRIFQKFKNKTIKEIFSMPVEKVMTKGPITITPDSLAKEAVKLMEKKSTYVLPVVDNNNVLVGLIRMHDLVQRGFTLTNEKEE